MKQRVSGIVLALAVSALPLSAQAFSNGGVYSVFDLDADGYVDREEFGHLVKRRHIRQEFRSMWQFDAIDSDRDGRISEREMLDVLQKEVQLRKELRGSESKR